MKYSFLVGAIIKTSNGSTFSITHTSPSTDIEDLVIYINKKVGFHLLTCLNNNTVEFLNPSIKEKIDHEYSLYKKKEESLLLLEKEKEEKYLKLRKEREERTVSIRKVIILKRKWDDPTPLSRPDDFDTYEVIDVTRRSDNLEFRKDFSPWYVGPVTLDNGEVCQNLYNLMNIIKVYQDDFDENGQIKKDYLTFRKWVFKSKKIKSRKGLKKSKYLYNLVQTSPKEIRLNDLETRLKLFVPLYAKEVVKTKSFLELKKKLEEGQKLCLVDFFVYPGSTLSNKRMIQSSYPIGPSLIIKMLLDGDLKVENGVLIDVNNVLNPKK